MPARRRPVPDPPRWIGAGLANRSEPPIASGPT